MILTTKELLEITKEWIKMANVEPDSIIRLVIIGKAMGVLNIIFISEIPERYQKEFDKLTRKIQKLELITMEELDQDLADAVAYRMHYGK